MGMVKVLMVGNDRAAPEGHTVVYYEDGKEYEVPEDIAEYFLANKTAEILGDGKKADPKAKK